MPVSLFDLKSQHAAIDTELRAAFDRVYRSGHYIMGPEITGFEQECAAYLGVKHALGVSSGTDALLLALMALDIGPGDEVICPSFSFFATAGCVARLGAIPVFVDSNLEDFNISVADTARKITAKTKAIIPVHLFGQSADMDGIMALAREHKLHVIEDAAQAFSARYKGKAAGGIGDFGCYSFFPTKNLGALGDAGLLVTNDDNLAERARILRVHGMEPKYHHQVIGANFRLDALQAALLRVKLPHLDSYTAARQRNADYYQAQLGSRVNSDQLAGSSEKTTEELPVISSQLTAESGSKLPTSAIILPTANCQLPTERSDTANCQLHTKAQSDKGTEAQSLKSEVRSQKSEDTNKCLELPTSAIQLPTERSDTVNCQLSEATLPTANCKLQTSASSSHIWNQYTLRIPGPGRRDALKAHLSDLGIGTEIYYPLPLHAQKCFAHLPTDPATLPNATQLSSEVLSLPIYPELPETYREQVVEGIRAFFHA